MNHFTDVVKAKPIDRSILRKLPDFHQPRDFVKASKHNQTEFYGSNTIQGQTDVASTSCDSKPLLNQEDKNKLAAKILRAEMMGNLELADKLRKEINDVSNVKSAKESDERIATTSSKSNLTNVTLLTKTDPRSGLVYPVKSKRPSDINAETKKKKQREADYSMKDLLEMEKFTSAEDQLSMFGATSSKMLTSDKTDESWTMDDMLEEKMNKKSKKTEDTNKINLERAVKEHKRLEQTLESCTFCIDSKKLDRHLIVALGLKTFLCIPPNQPLVELQCSIVPMSHVSSCIQMDEDVYDEMIIWRKGLVAMYRARDMDVIFIELVKNVRYQPHTNIECYPVPFSIGDLAPMYFKKAILECDEEWAQNKQIIDLGKKPLRKSIPKGFSYFAVDFGLQPGYAHVIENESKFPATFGKEIIGGMLDLNPNLWRRPVQQKLKQQTDRVNQLKDAWKPFDWTERVKERLKND